MTVDVQIACTDCVPRVGELAAWAEAALAGDARALCIRIVGQQEGLELNERFRQQDRPTNVLAFEADEPTILGDIAICAPVVAREAAEQGKRLADHYAHLVVHGVLHLKGMDHKTTAEAVAMETEEVRLLGGLGIADPYLVEPEQTAEPVPGAKSKTWAGERTRATEGATP